MNVKTMTMAELKRLVSSVDDNTGDHIVWVDLEGDVRISCLQNGDFPAKWATENKHRFRFRLETLCRGNGYVGEDAAADEGWMKELFSMLKNNYREGSGETGYLVEA